MPDPTDIIPDDITPKPGIYFDVPFTDYIRWKAVNGSMLVPYTKSAKRARYEMLNPRFATDAQELGEATHACILEPDRYDREYVTMPEFEGHPNSNAHKAEKQRWMLDNAGKIAVANDDQSKIKAMLAEVRANADAAEILYGTKGKNEASFIWLDKETGLLCKGRVDRLCNWRWPAIVDVKTTRAIGVGIREFPSEVAKFKYHMKMAMYREGLNVLAPAMRGVVIIAVQNEGEFDVVVHEMDMESLAHGEAMFRRLLFTHKSCLDSGKWPGVCPEVNLLRIPSWAEETMEV